MDRKGKKKAVPKAASTTDKSRVEIFVCIWSNISVGLWNKMEIDFFFLSPPLPRFHSFFSSFSPPSSPLIVTSDEKMVERGL